MKKKNILLYVVSVLVLVLVIAIFSYTAYLERYKPGPPSLMVTCNTGDEVWGKEATLGTYSWSWLGGGVNSDSISPLDMEKEGIISSFLIDEKEGLIKLYIPASGVKFSVSSESILGAESETIEKSATSPKKDEAYSFTAKVNYVYTVKVEYKKGTVYYAFVVKSK